VTSGAKGNLAIALLLAGVVASLTMMLQHVPLPFFLVFFTIPGIIGSMALSGNVHAFPLWLAAWINFVLYLLLVLAVGAIIRALLRWMRSRPASSTGDNHL